MYKLNNTHSTKNPSIIIMDGVMKVKIPLKEILYIQAEHVYIRIHLINNQQILHRISLANFMQKLPTKNFMQVHRSYIINFNHVSWWNHDQIAIEGQRIPISRSRRKIVNQTLLSSS